MYAYGYVLIFIICIHIHIHTNIHFYYLERVWYHVNEHQMVSRSHYALQVSTTLLLRWYYVNPVLTTLSLGPYHALWRLRSCYVNFEHVQNLTTSLPFLQILLRSYHASTTLIPFLPRSSGSPYALALFRERSQNVVDICNGGIKNQQVQNNEMCLKSVWYCRVMCLLMPRSMVFIHISTMV